MVPILEAFSLCLGTPCSVYSMTLQWGVLANAVRREAKEAVYFLVYLLLLTPELVCAVQVSILNALTSYHMLFLGKPTASHGVAFPILYKLRVQLQIGNLDFSPESRSQHLTLYYTAPPARPRSISTLTYQIHPELNSLSPL